MDNGQITDDLQIKVKNTKNITMSNYHNVGRSSGVGSVNARLMTYVDDIMPGKAQNSCLLYHEDIVLPCTSCNALTSGLQV